MRCKLTALVDARTVPCVGVRFVACTHCPSAHFPPDPEVRDLLKFGTREQQIDSCFRCGWDQAHLCRGYVTRLKLNTAEITNALEREQKEYHEEV